MPTKSVLYTTEPDWKISRQGLHHSIPAAAQSWIYESHSLTQRLRSFYGNAVNVKILNHQWQKPFNSERHMLQLQNNRYGLIREVLLSADDKPLILARTVLPQKTLRGTQRILSHLGNRPLGEVIFSYPKLQRMEMDIAEIAPTHWSQHISRHISIKQTIWARRTVYAIQHRYILVSEFFLPEVL